jgi:diadenylate cyclase
MEVILSLWRPLLEILFIWLLIYSVIRLFEGTRAMQVLMGLILMIVIFNIAKFFKLHTINWVLTKVFAVGVVAFLIIFQPELRRALARIGQKTFWGGLLKKGGTIDELVQACDYLSRNRVGALIAIERDIGLKNYIESGIAVDAKMSQELLITLFEPKTPTHDGGVIIVGDRIASCGSLFPLSHNTEMSRFLGTRHRAAMGISEESDAVSVVVSEETGAISLAVNGQLTRGLDPEQLKKNLLGLFKAEGTKSTLRNFIEKNWKIHRQESTPQ